MGTRQRAKKGLFQSIGMQRYIQCPIGILGVDMTVNIDSSNTQYSLARTAQLQSNTFFKIPLCIERECEHGLTILRFKRQCTFRHMVRVSTNKAPATQLPHW